MNKLEALADAIAQTISKSTSDEIEIIAWRTSSALTRVANSQIHQNVAETNTAVSIRAVVDGRVGTAATNRPEPEHLARTALQAAENAAFSPRVDDWPGLPENPLIIEDKSAESTDDCSPGKRAELLKKALTSAKNAKLELAASLQTTSTDLLIGNSHSSISQSSLSDVELNLMMLSLDSSGYSSWVGCDLDDLDIESACATARDKALAGCRPTEVEPGRYRVILEPAAVADMFSFLAYIGLGAQAIQEKRSFIAGRFGERLVDERITFWDDANDPRTLGPSFDYEGVPKEKVVFFNQGRAESVVYDTRTGAKGKRPSTGHALPAPNPAGPLPINLFLGTGERSLDEMIGDCERSILVTRFHYTNIEDPMETTMTGLTRDGTFLIENGKIKSGLKNLRFTQSILEALNHVLAVGNQGVLVQAILGPCWSPALAIDNFAFTGRT